MMKKNVCQVKIFDFVIQSEVSWRLAWVLGNSGYEFSAWWWPLNISCNYRLHVTNTFVCRLLIFATPTVVKTFSIWLEAVILNSGVQQLKHFYVLTLTHSHTYLKTYICRILGCQALHNAALCCFKILTACFYLSWNTETVDIQKTLSQMPYSWMLASWITMVIMVHTVQFNSDHFSSKL